MLIISQTKYKQVSLRVSALLKKRLQYWRSFDGLSDNNIIVTIFSKFYPTVTEITRQSLKSIELF